MSALRNTIQKLKTSLQGRTKRTPGVNLAISPKQAFVSGCAAQKQKRKVNKKLLALPVGILMVLVIMQSAGIGIVKPAYALDWGLTSIIANTFYLVVLWPLGLLSVLCMGLLKYVAEFGTGQFINNYGVNLGWTVTRDISNMFFIIILLIIAFSTVLRIKSYSYQALVPRVVIMALLINFSKTICGVFIDLSQVMTLTFIRATSDALSRGYMTSALGLDQIFAFEQISGNVQGWADFALTGRLFVSLIVGMIILTLTNIVLITYVVTFLFRIVMLWFLVVTSPLAFITWTFPKSQKYSSQWWQEFGTWVTVGPVAAFFLWLSMTMFTFGTQGGAGLSQSVSGALSSGLTTAPPQSFTAGLTAITSPNSIANFILALSLLIAGQKFIFSMSTQVGGALKGATAAAVGAVGWTMAKHRGALKAIGGGAASGLNVQAGRLVNAVRGRAGRDTDTLTGMTYEGALSRVSNVPLIGTAVKGELARYRKAESAESKGYREMAREMTPQEISRTIRAGAVSAKARRVRAAYRDVAPHHIEDIGAAITHFEGMNDAKVKEMTPDALRQMRDRVITQGGGEARWEQIVAGKNRSFLDNFSSKQLAATGYRKVRNNVTNALELERYPTYADADTNLYGPGGVPPENRMRFYKGFDPEALNQSGEYYAEQGAKQAPQHSPEETEVLKSDVNRHEEWYQGLGDNDARRKEAMSRITAFRSVDQAAKTGKDKGFTALNFEDFSPTAIAGLSEEGQNIIGQGAALVKGKDKDILAGEIGRLMHSQRSTEIDASTPEELMKGSIRKRNVSDADIQTKRAEILQATKGQQGSEDDRIKAYFKSQSEQQSNQYVESAKKLQSLELLNKNMPLNPTHRLEHERGHGEMDKLPKGKTMEMWNQLPQQMQQEISAQIRKGWNGGKSMSVEDIAHEAFAESFAFNNTNALMAKREGPDMAAKRLRAAGPLASPEMTSLLQDAGVKFTRRDRMAQQEAKRPADGSAEASASRISENKSGRPVSVRVENIADLRGASGANAKPVDIEPSVTSPEAGESTPVSERSTVASGPTVAKSVAASTMSETDLLRYIRDMTARLQELQKGGKGTAEELRSLTRKIEENKETLDKIKFTPEEKPVSKPNKKPNTPPKAS